MPVNPFRRGRRADEAARDPEAVVPTADGGAGRWDLNRVVIAYVGRPGYLDGPERVAALVGEADAPEAIAMSRRVADALDQVPGALDATWPTERILALASEIAVAGYPSLSDEALEALRNHWAYSLR